MIIVSGPFSSKDPVIKQQRVDTIAKACAKLMLEGKTPVAMSPLLYGLSIIDKSGHNLPDNYEFWEEFCKTFVTKGDTLYVLDMEGWQDSTGVMGEIEEAKNCNIPVYLVESITLDYIKIL